MGQQVNEFGWDLASRLDQSYTKYNDKKLKHKNTKKCIEHSTSREKSINYLPWAHILESS